MKFNQYFQYLGTIFEELFIQIKATTTSLIIAHAAC